MGTTYSETLDNYPQENKQQPVQYSPKQVPMRFNHDFDTIDWIANKKSDKITFHKRLGADILPDEDLIQQMSTELSNISRQDAAQVFRFWTNQTINNLFRICLDKTHKLDCRYLTIVLLSRYIIYRKQHSVEIYRDMYVEEDLDDFYEKMIQSVTYEYVK
jgi:hypothetical protein